jgi:FkbM family methyltransferase
MRRAFRTQPGLACCDIVIANLPISGRCGEASQVAKSSPERARGAAATEKDLVLRRCCLGHGWNIGIYTQFHSRCVAPTGDVQAFEPSPENFGRLQSATCKLPNVRLSQSAVGESSRKPTLYVSDKLNVDHRAYLPEGDSRHSVPIEMIALQAWRTRGSHQNGYPGI